MKFLSSVFLINVLAIFGGRQGAGKSMTTEQNSMTTQGQNTRKATTARSGKGGSGSSTRRGLNDDDSSSVDSSASSDNSLAGNASVALRASCDCAWTKKWSCPGFKTKGNKGTATDDNTVCYEYCCGGNVQQCLKCDKNEALCEVTSDMTQCSKFKKHRVGQWRDEKTKACLDMFESNKFGLWGCKGGNAENQLSKKKNGAESYCFDFKGGNMCVDDATKGIRFKRKNGDCLVCDKSKKKCGKPKVNQGECSDFEKSGDHYKLTNGGAAGECLDRFLLGWGSYTCVDDNRQQIFSADDGKQCIKSKWRPPGKHCL